MSLLIALGTPMIARAQDCAGAFDRSQAVITAYREYDAHVGQPGSAKAAATNMIPASKAFMAYMSDYFTEYADNTGADYGSAISQCDPQTRIAIYKAVAMPYVMVARMQEGPSRPDMLQHIASILGLAIQVMKKTNTADDDMADLVKDTLRAYNRAHLSLPQALLDADAYIKSQQPTPAPAATLPDTSTPDPNATPIIMLKTPGVNETSSPL